MQLSAGSRWRSAVDDTEVIVVRPAEGDVVLECGGYPMVALGTESPGGEIAEGHDGGTLLGKRYVDEESGIEVLCTAPGVGSLALSGRSLQLKSAKPLPSSD